MITITSCLSYLLVVSCADMCSQKRNLKPPPNALNANERKLNWQCSKLILSNVCNIAWCKDLLNLNIKIIICYVKCWPESMLCGISEDDKTHLEWWKWIQTLKFYRITKDWLIIWECPDGFRFNNQDWPSRTGPNCNIPLIQSICFLIIIDK